MKDIVLHMVEVLHCMKQEIREDQEKQEKSEVLGKKKEILETLENLENKEIPENQETQETPETLTTMKQEQDHAHRGRKGEEINQEEDIGKNIETPHGMVIKTEDVQIESTVQKEDMVEMLTGTTGQAMAGGDAEKVARSPWVMGGLL